MLARLLGKIKFNYDFKVKLNKEFIHSPLTISYQDLHGNFALYKITPQHKDINKVNAPALNSKVFIHGNPEVNLDSNYFVELKHKGAPNNTV